MPETIVTIRTEYIELEKLLKLWGAASTGGTAKAWILEGEVRVDGVTERRRGRKIRAGQVVDVQGSRCRVEPAKD